MNVFFARSISKIKYVISRYGAFKKIMPCVQDQLESRDAPKEHDRAFESLARIWNILRRTSGPTWRLETYRCFLLVVFYVAPLGQLKRSGLI